MNDFKQTVDLKDKMQAKPDNSSRPPARKENPRPQAKPKLQPKPKKRSSRARAIDEVYGEEAEKELRQASLQQIERARARRFNVSIYKALNWLLLLALLGTLAYFLWLAPGQGEPAGGNGPAEAKWYRVELVNDEIYFGQITDPKANPVELSKVYYDYDQLNPAGEGGSGSESPSAGPGQSGNLRLVKRGSESQGSSGTMLIYQAQIEKVDVLSEDSKVLKAIVEHEQ